MKKYALSFPIDAALEKQLQAEKKRTGLSRAHIARTALRVVFNLIKAKRGGTHDTR